MAIMADAGAERMRIGACAFNTECEKPLIAACGRLGAVMGDERWVQMRQALVELMLRDPSRNGAGCLTFAHQASECFPTVVA